MMCSRHISKILSWACQEVAVKILTEQDFHPERVNEFLREVCSGGNLNSVYYRHGLFC